MTFTDWANNNVFTLSFILCILLLVGIRIGYMKGGWGRNMVYLWSLMIFIPYLLISPYFFYSNKKAYIVGTDISRYYGLHFFYSCSAIFFFIVGYWVVNGDKNKWDLPVKKEMPKPDKYISWIFYCTYGIVMLNMAIGGINIGNMFLGDEVVGMGAMGASYFLQNFADSLISVLILAYLFGIKKQKLLIWLAFSFFLFFLLGFRYRIILTLSGLIFVYIFKNRLSFKQIIGGVFLGVVILYFTVFSTMNRRALIFKDYDALVYNPMEFKLDAFFDQTRGALADMAIYKLYDNPNVEVEHDEGQTIFGYIFIRMIPRFIYPDKDRFYPPPQMVIQVKSYDAWWGSRSGEACLSNGAVYIAWGWLGIVIFYFAWGVFLKKLANSISLADPLALCTYIVFALASFQWITRGYFPQVFDHFAYLIIPVWVAKFIRKRVAHASN